MRKIFKPTINRINNIVEIRKTKCIINWVDANGTKRRSVGVALKHPNDSHNSALGIHLAESRAKADMLKKHLDSLNDIILTLGFACNTYQNALEQEVSHIKELTYYES